MSEKRKRVKTYHRYPISLKRKIAKSYLSGEASYAILAEENGLRDKGVVKEFVKWYRRKIEKEPEFAKRTEDIKDKSNAKILTGKELQERVKALEKELKLAELKTEMLETMIDLAEEKFKLDIRKKSGAKQ